MSRSLSRPLDLVKGPKGTAPNLLENTLDRFELGGGAYGWIYAFHHREALQLPPHVVAGHEIAVQLAGTWELHVWGRPVERFAPGDVFTVPAGVRHTYALCADDQGGLQVGFSLPPFDPRSSEPTAWTRCRLESDRARSFVDLAEWVLAWRRLARTDEHDAGPEQIGAALRELVARELDRVAESPFERARRELEQYLDRGLYLAHIADAAGLSQKTLTRRFVEKTGVTPIRLRTELRLQRAIRTLWSDPGTSVAHAGRSVGFESTRFFHRLSVSLFGATPGQLARRTHGPTR